MGENSRKRFGKIPTFTTIVLEKDIPTYFAKLCEWTEMSVQDESSVEYGGVFENYLNARKNDWEGARSSSMVRTFLPNPLLKPFVLQHRRPSPHRHLPVPSKRLTTPDTPSSLFPPGGHSFGWLEKSLFCLLGRFA
jgi:hypothetical protein